MLLYDFQDCSKLLTFFIKCEIYLEKSSKGKKVFLVLIIEGHEYQDVCHLAKAISFHPGFVNIMLLLSQNRCILNMYIKRYLNLMSPVKDMFITFSCA